jgi:hypothetical protein
VHPGTRVMDSIAGARTAVAAARLNDEPRHRSRPTARQRADQGLLEGRLLILHADQHTITARWRGEGHIHRLGYQVGVWHCTCPSRADQCSHLLALRRVVAVRGTE